MELEKIQEKIKEIEKEIQETPYHKATEHYIGKLKAKLARLRSQIIEKGTKKGVGTGFAIKKEGDGTVVLVGFPSVGKSTILNELTGAKSKVASYPFTTLKVIPGILNFQGAKFQVLDVPGLIQGSAMGKGRGREVLSVIRIADLLLLVASVENPKTFEVMEEELYQAGVRINEKKPQVLIEKRNKGGIEILGRTKSISKPTIKSLAQEFSILNAKITFKQDVTPEQLIDVFLSNRVYAPILKVLSKIDLLSPEQLKRVLKSTNYLPISAKQSLGLERLKEQIFSKLNLIRVYLRESLKTKASKQPLICQKGTTVLQTASKISQNLAKEIRGAKITGPSASHKNQFVGLGHQFLDGDEVYFVK